MTRRVIAVTAMGLFGAALFAANKPMTATLKDGAGKGVGTAKISDGPSGNGVKIVLNLKGLPPGETPSISTRPRSAKAQPSQAREATSTQLTRTTALTTP